MQRQENLRWVSELSYVEEKEQWQEQINQLKKQLDFSVSICQTLMQDQQVKFIIKVNFLNVVEVSHVFLKLSVTIMKFFLSIDSILSAPNSSHGSLQCYAQQCWLSSSTPYNAPVESVLCTANMATE